MATRTPITPDAVLARIDEELRRLRKQRAELEEEMQQIAGATGGAIRRQDDDSELAKREQMIANTYKQQAYLEQIRTIVREFPGATQVMGDLIVGRIRGVTRRALILTFAQNVAFLVAGWLLSLLASPTTIFR